MSPVTILGLGVALGIGLLIGIERERRKGTGPQRGPAGVRTFALVALLGAIGQLGAGAVGVVIVVAVTGMLGVVAYRRSSATDPGLTTEVALVLTCALGALAQQQASLAAGLGVVVAVLLVSRDWLHKLARDRLTDQEVTDGVMLAAAALVVLPLLPDRAIDSFGVLNPRVVWMLAVLVMLINAAGYVALRALGGNAGLAVAGLAGGFVSSTATIGSMGSRARQHVSLRRGAIAGATLSSVGTVIQLAVVIAVTNRMLLTRLWPALLGAAVVATVYGAAYSIRAVRSANGSGAIAGRAFEPRMAITFTVTVTAVIYVAALLSHFFGETGGLLGVAVAGFADAHSAAVSAASMALAGAMAPNTAVFGVLLGFTTNTVSKVVVAWTAGGGRFALQVTPGLALMLVAAWIGAWFG